MADSRLREIATHLLDECEGRWTERGGLEVTVDFEDGRRRTILLDERVRLGAALVEFRCPLVSADRVDPRMALLQPSHRGARHHRRRADLHPSQPSEGLTPQTDLQRPAVASIADTLDASLLVSNPSRRGRGAVIPAWGWARRASDEIRSSPRRTPLDEAGRARRHEPTVPNDRPSPHPVLMLGVSVPVSRASSGGRAGRWPLHAPPPGPRPRSGTRRPRRAAEALRADAATLPRGGSPPPPPPPGSRGRP